MNIGDKGICRLSVVPMRSKGEDISEMISQLLFGDHYEIIALSDNGNWLKIRTNFDDYEGWIDSKQHTPITEGYFDQINNSDYKISLDLMSGILHNRHHISVLLGSVLPIATNELFKMEEQLAFNGESKSLSEKRDFEFVKTVALKYLNAPYLWGGKTPFGIDCSGFVQQVYRICGYKLNRDTSLQVKQGIEIEELKDARPGDLAFFSNQKGKVSHVGIIFPEGSIIHASGKVRIDKLNEAGIYNEELRTHTHKLNSLRRILNQ